MHNENYKKQQQLTATVETGVDAHHPLPTQHTIEPQRHAANAVTPSIASIASIAYTVLSYRNDITPQQ